MYSCQLGVTSDEVPPCFSKYQVAIFKTGYIETFQLELKQLPMVGPPTYIWAGKPPSCGEGGGTGGDHSERGDIRRLVTFSYISHFLPPLTPAFCGMNGFTKTETV